MTKLSRLEYDVLRVASVHDGTATTPLLAMQCGTTRQVVAPAAARLCQAGLLTRGTLGGQVCYGVTSAGREQAGPPRNRSAFMLVEVDEEKYLEVQEMLLALGIVRSCTEHQKGCCCKNCPWRGDHG